MDRIGRSYALRKTVSSFSFSHHRLDNGSLRLTRPFSSGISLQNESEKNTPDASPSFKIIRTPAPETNRPRAVDARSLGVSRAGPDQANILRAPRLRLRQAPVRGRGGGATGRPGAFGRGSGGARAGGKGRTANASSRRARRRRTDDEDGEEGGRDINLDPVFDEVKNASKPKPVRYTPVSYDITALKETWPALPTNSTASATSSVLERLNLSSRRYANGYVPPMELGKRLFEGERVLFSSEEEKKLAMEEVSKMAQERANKLTQRKGDLIEPEDSSFVAIKDEERKALVGQLVQGKYDDWQKGDVRHPVLDEVQRQLYNNETYRITGKEDEFMVRFQSLLASSQRAKRA